MVGWEYIVDQAPNLICYKGKDLELWNLSFRFRIKAQPEQVELFTFKAEYLSRRTALNAWHKVDIIMRNKGA